jgi:hypothetical protein
VKALACIERVAGLLAQAAVAVARIASILFGIEVVPTAVIAKCTEAGVAIDGHPIPHVRRLRRLNGW